ncbi:MAG: membrane protein insertion efficiency factor YidD [Candidatus Lightella neohaematopini]|nr:membrane protein insertion efficiency factor YidD [Candidatus Lightella neohaematopini]MCV2528794.1 membrane protein insertion efficiency factor YidD [Candidatus Lightella neohaematopini]
MLVLILTNIIYWYKIIISPLLGKHCRFIPSCSQFTIEVITTFGLVKGIWFSIKRIVKCSPISNGGYDPVNKYL